MLMKKYTRILLFAAMLILMFSTVTAFGASSGSDKKMIKARAGKFMKAAKNYNRKKLGQNIVSTSTYTFISNPIGKAVRQMNKKHLKYSIGKITIKNQRAVVKVKVTYFDGYEIFKKAFKSTITWYSKNRKATAAQINRKVYSYASAYYKKASKSKYIKRAALTIKMKHYDSGWLITSASDNYDKVVNGNYLKAYNAVFKK